MKAACVIVAVVFAASLIGLIPSAEAGTTSFSFQNSTLTRLQSSMAGAMEGICSRIDAAGAANPLQADLLAACGQLNGLGQAQIGGALESLSPNGAFTVVSGVTETSAAQFALVTTRLFSLRQGATGVSLQGFRLLADGKSAALRELASLSDAGNGASADALDGRLGAFVSGTFNFGDRDRTTREPAFDFVTGSVAAGVDYRFQRNLVAGLALSFQTTDADVDGVLSGLGEVDTKSYGVSAYGTYYLQRAYLDWQLGFAWNTYDTTRRMVFGTFDRTARGDTDGQQYTASLGGGYEFPIGATTVTPYGRLEYVYLHVEDFQEHGAQGLDLKIDAQNIASLRSALGARVSHAISMPIAVLVPQVHAEWLHEFLDYRRTVNAQFVNDPFATGFGVKTERADNNYGAVGVGLSAVFRGGVSAFVSYETVVGLSNITNHSFTGGARVEF